MMNSNGAICPKCKVAANFLFHTKDLNRKITDKTFTYWQCPDCRLIFLPDIPGDLGRYYKEDYYQIPPLEKLSRNARKLKYQVDMVRKFVTHGRLLEIGSAFGTFAYQAKKAGFEVDAIEMSARCCDYLSRVVGVNAIQSDKPHDAIKGLRGHDVIALWHNIEHLPDPWACLDAAVENLNPGGILLVATPNPASFGFRILGPSWPHVDAPRHVNLIPVSFLTKQLESWGLSQVMLTTNDKGARSWNRFTWQRLFMNHFTGKGAQMMAFFAGALASIPMALWDRRELNGSAYTVIYQKKATGID